MILTVHDLCRVSNKKPADFVIPSLEDFSAVIRFNDGDFEIHVETGPVAFRLSEEKRLDPGDLIVIGDLEFEASRFNYGKWSSIGQRASMEDCDLVIQDLRVLDEPVAYYAVFDGHGGSQCSSFLKENLHRFLQKYLKGCRDVNAWHERVCQAFEECDLAFDQAFPVISRQIGSAALVCMIHKNLLVTVNCGDCRAVLSRGGQAVQLTTDHRPELPSERLRIEKAAGFVVNGRVQGKLAVSRAFGDFEFKGMNEQSLGKGIGKIVTCMPEVVVSQIDFGIDEFLVIGCDGLFEAFSNPDIVKETRNRLKRMKVTEQDPCRVVKDLVTEAVHTRRTLDNVSALLITFCAGLA
jgi:protein phosphatase 2C family protein 2/3